MTSPEKEKIIIGGDHNSHIHSQKNGSSMVLQNGQRFDFSRSFAIWTWLRDLQTILGCEES